MMFGSNPLTSGAGRRRLSGGGNDRILLEAIRRNPGISRPALSRATGISSSGVALIVNRLLEGGLVVEERLKEYGQVGRRPTSLRVAYDQLLAVGVEIDRSESRVALVDFSGKLLRCRAVPWHPQPDVFLSHAHEAICSIAAHADPMKLLGVGVSVPGSLEADRGRVIAAVNLNWYGLEIDEPLRDGLTVPVYYQNNANLCALAEGWFSSPGEQSYRDFIYVLAAQGLGTGIIVNGQLLRGASSVGGEFGHTVLYIDGRKCACGNRGCWEQYASEGALCRTYGELAGCSSGEAEYTGETIVQAARSGDVAAQQALARTASDLALGFINIMAVFDPEAIVLGGYLANAWELVADTVWGVIRSRAPQYSLGRLRILPARHGRDSVLMGAAALVFSHWCFS